MESPRSSSPSRCAALTRRSSRWRRSMANAIRAAAADGELWRLWYTSVPSPETTSAWLERALDMRERLGAMPFAVRDNASGDIVGSTRYFNVDAVEPPARDRPHVVRAARAADGDQHRMQAAAADARVRDARLHRRRIPHALVQSSVAQRDRAARREAGRRAAQPPADAGRQPARHRRVQHHRRRMARGQGASQVPARPQARPQLASDTGSP